MCSYMTALNDKTSTVNNYDHMTIIYVHITTYSYIVANGHLIITGFFSSAVSLT